METNENIIEPQETIVSGTGADGTGSLGDSGFGEGFGEITGGGEPGTGDPFGPGFGDDLIEEEPTQPEPVKVDILSVLIRLALTGYELPDIIAVYGKFVGWDGELVNSAVLTYGHDFGQFLMDEGLIDSEVEKKFLNYTMHYHIVDSLERLGKVDFKKEYDDFKDWILTWAETKNYQSVLDALDTLDGKKIVEASKVEDVIFRKIPKKNDEPENLDWTTKVLMVNGINTKYSAIKESNFAGSSVFVDNSKIESEKNTNTEFTIYATDDVNINNLTVEGVFKSSNSNQLRIRKVYSETPGVLNITNSTFTADGYNCIMIGNGAEECDYKEINIIDCDFSKTLANNAINIYGWAEGAVINIKNCNFTGSLSNPIRFFNSSNTSATVNIENCVFGQWVLEQPNLFTGVNEELGYDYQYAYAGMIICEDHLSGSTEAEMENKKFAKITLNITNCTGPFGKIVAPKNLADVCGCMNKNQLIYVCYYKTVPYVADNGKNVYSLGYAGYEDHFPKINIS